MSKFNAVKQVVRTPEQMHDLWRNGLRLLAKDAEERKQRSERHTGKFNRSELFHEAWRWHRIRIQNAQFRDDTFGDTLKWFYPIYVNH